MADGIPASIDDDDDDEDGTASPRSLPRDDELNREDDGADDGEADNEDGCEVTDLRTRVLRGAASRYKASSGSESIETDIIIDDEGISDILKTNGIVINPSKVSQKPGRKASQGH